MGLVSVCKKRFKWSREENKKLADVIESTFRQEKRINWKIISQYFPNRTVMQCTQHWKRIKKTRLPKVNKWRSEEDEKLRELINKFGFKWKHFETYFEGRSGSSIRARYLQQLQPNINKTKWTENEDKMICTLFCYFSTHWIQYKSYFSGRTENMIKNRYYSHLKKVIVDQNNSLTDANNYSEDLVSIHKNEIEIFNEVSQFLISNTQSDKQTELSQELQFMEMI